MRSMEAWSKTSLPAVMGRAEQCRDISCHVQETKASLGGELQQKKSEMFWANQTQCTHYHTICAKLRTVSY